MNQGKHPKFRSFAAFALALALCLTLAGPALAADDATASSIRLAKTEGTVSATNSAGRNISLVKNLRLFNGYHVVTESKSYAWLNLDSAKLLKEDASSNVEVRKSGKKLEVLLRSGNLFFNVTEPLDDDETLNIRTSTTLTGVRGTCGWVEVVDRWNTNVYILEGEVECAVTDPVSGEEKLTTVSAGETATFTVIRGGSSAATNGVEISKKSCEVKDVPGYVLVDLAQDRTLCNDIRAASGLDILGDLSRSGDPAAEARRRQEAEEQEAASRLASIAAREQAQANNVEAAPNTAASGELNMVGTWGWRYDESSKTLYIGGSGATDGYSYPWLDYIQEIESVVIGSGITSIGASAFHRCTSLTSVIIPSSVTRIGNGAFSYCSALASVTIPDGVKEISNNTFDICTSLASVTIPDSVTRIGESAFRNTALTSVTIPNRVHSIGMSAFSGCSNLTSVTLPSSVTSITTYAFSDCTSLTDVYYGGSAEQWSAISIIQSGNTCLTNATIHYAGASGSTDIPGPLNMVGTWGWYYDENTKTLYIGGSGEMMYHTVHNGENGAPWYAQYGWKVERVVIGEGITRIGDSAFYACTGLTSVSIPDSVKLIDDRAFLDCRSLTSVTIPSGVTEVAALAFSGCSNLTSVTIPSGVTYIYSLAFSNCTNLTSVTIPSTVTKIAHGAFSGCTGLTDVYYGGSEAQWNAVGIDSGENGNLLNAAIHYNSR